ncbi:hypothetical protein P5673_031198, partial [Acropora cervicornis]
INHDVQVFHEMSFIQNSQATANKAEYGMKDNHSQPLCNPCRYTGIVSRFGRNPKALCLMFNAIVHLIYVNHNNCQLQSCNHCTDAENGNQQGSPLSHCFGFIDGTVCRGGSRVVQ